MAASSLGARPPALSPPCVLALLGSRLGEPAHDRPEEPLMASAPAIEKGNVAPSSFPPPVDSPEEFI